jgi:hypothetical protein
MIIGILIGTLLHGAMLAIRGFTGPELKQKPKATEKWIRQGSSLHS